jgi:hypothetical protein
LNECAGENPAGTKKGANSLFNDWSTTPVDEDAMDGWNEFRQNYEVGDVDPFNKQRITKAELKAANNGYSLFNLVVGSKKDGIAKFMEKNYASVYKLDVNSSDYGAAKEANYNLFLKIYMYQEKDGTWKRNESLWTKQQDGTYTPNAPTN